MNTGDVLAAVYIGVPLGLVGALSSTATAWIAIIVSLAITVSTLADLLRWDARTSGETS